MLNYVSNQNTDTVSVRGGATIVVSGDLCWTSESPNSKVTNTSVVVTGAMTEKGHRGDGVGAVSLPRWGLGEVGGGDAGDQRLCRPPTAAELESTRGICRCL